MNEELLALAQETQRQHAALIDRVSRYRTTEARAEVRDELLSLRSDFTQKAMELTGVSAPFMWEPANPEHAVAVAVRGDIADTEARLANLAAGEALQKIIKTDFGYGFRWKMPELPGPGPVLGVLGAVLIVVAILVLKR